MTCYSAQLLLNMATKQSHLSLLPLKTNASVPNRLKAVCTSVVRSRHRFCSSSGDWLKQWCRGGENTMYSIKTLVNIRRVMRGTSGDPGEDFKDYSHKEGLTMSPRTKKLISTPDKFLFAHSDNQEGVRRCIFCRGIGDGETSPAGSYYHGRLEGRKA